MTPKFGMRKKFTTYRIKKCCTEMCFILYSPDPRVPIIPTRDISEGCQKLNLLRIT